MKGMTRILEIAFLIFVMALAFQAQASAQKYETCTNNCPGAWSQQSLQYCSDDKLEIQPSEIEVCVGQPVQGPVVVRVVPTGKMTKGEGIGHRITRTGGGLDWADGNPEDPLQFNASSLTSKHSHPAYSTASTAKIYNISAFYFEDKDYRNGKDAFQYTCRKQVAAILKVYLATDSHCTGGRFHAVAADKKKKSNKTVPTAPQE